MTLRSVSTPLGEVVVSAMSDVVSSWADDWSGVVDWLGVAARGVVERVGSAETESGEAVLFASG